jgi:hypothetical protein
MAGQDDSNSAHESIAIPDPGIAQVGQNEGNSSIPQLTYDPTGEYTNGMYEF